ncbi:hypothetical protein HYPSUDRAFT_556717 [Hypholoma sublateritium FD-334 SS-4]|uniref:Uncharacterized protein n=1 Tax=Hypholoma sublateritium (strain FD-334 SS-4) TaxID=945553 RepID=A0A0D2KG13_HYPSF|nr:hypothetical protein HYPSUDRAFT_556717 [Hypholoma sublateritium FD-334 SS-4]
MGVVCTSCSASTGTPSSTHAFTRTVRLGLVYWFWGERSEDGRVRSLLSPCDPGLSLAAPCAPRAVYPLRAFIETRRSAYSATGMYRGAYATRSVDGAERACEHAPPLLIHDRSRPPRCTQPRARIYISKRPRLPSTDLPLCYLRHADGHYPTRRDVVRAYATQNVSCLFQMARQRVRACASGTVRLINMPNSILPGSWSFTKREIADA